MLEVSTVSQKLGKNSKISSCEVEKISIDVGPEQQTCKRKVNLTQSIFEAEKFLEVRYGNWDFKPCAAHPLGWGWELIFVEIHVHI